MGRPPERNGRLEKRPNVFQFLLSADIITEKPDELAAAIAQRLRLPDDLAQRLSPHNEPYVAWFLRVNPSLGISPTRLEIMGHEDEPNEADPVLPAYLRSLAEFQGAHRPMKTHSTVVVVRTMDEVLARLHRRRVPFRLAPATNEMPWERVWVGTTAERPSYDPAWDGGLCLEFVPMSALRMPRDLTDSPVPEDPVPGTFARVLSKEVLVRDLDDSLRRLRENLDWEPANIVDDTTDGVRRAGLPFELPNSAELLLSEPREWSSERGRFLHTWGPGCYSITIAVHDTVAVADRLRAAGTIVVDEIVDGRTRLHLDPSQIGGLRIELIEHESTKP